MMTYEDYQAAIVINCEAMRETRRKESAERKALEEERLKKNQEAFDNFTEFKKRNNELYQGRMSAVSEKYKTERIRLHVEHARVIEQWRAEHGISTPPPYVELPSGERPNREGGIE